MKHPSPTRALLRIADRRQFRLRPGNHLGCRHRRLVRAPGAWSSGVAASNTLAQINNGGTAQVFYGSMPAVAGGIWLGANAGNIGNLTVFRQIFPPVLTVTNTLQVGLFGQGTLIVSGGAR